MTFQGVPWFVGGGAENPPEAARLLAYFATNADEGVASPGDCRPLAMVVPAGQLRIGPGALVIRNRKPGAFAESYLLRNPDDHVVAVPATGAAGGRSDLVYAAVRDRQYGDEPQPDNVAAGPYAFVLRVPVAAGTRTVAQAIAQGALPPGTVGVALARVDLPANTGTVTQGMVVDLRTLPAPRSQRRALTASPTVPNNLTSPDYLTWPPEAAWTVTVPAWATHAIVHITAAGVQFGTVDTYGGMRPVLGTVIGQPIAFGVDSPDGQERADFHAIDTLTIPEALRGTSQVVKLEAYRYGSAGFIQSTDATTVIADVEFQERV